MSSKSLATIHSSLGFIFTPNLDQVLLIKKSQPEFHRGKLNGLGGKCERGESTLACLSREVKEEANLDILTSEWKSVGRMEWTPWQVEIFTVRFEGKPGLAKSMTSDPVKWYSVAHLPPNLLSNLTWLIPLAIDVLDNPAPPQVSIAYC